jgi:hypothetical protein
VARTPGIWFGRLIAQTKVTAEDYTISDSQQTYVPVSLETQASPRAPKHLNRGHTCTESHSKGPTIIVIENRLRITAY